MWINAYLLLIVFYFGGTKRLVTSSWMMWTSCSFSIFNQTNQRNSLFWMITIISTMVTIIKNWRTEHFSDNNHDSIDLLSFKANFAEKA